MTTVLAIIGGVAPAGALLHSGLDRRWGRREGRRETELGDKRCQDTGRSLWKTSLLHGFEPSGKAFLNPFILNVGM